MGSLTKDSGILELGLQRFLGNIIMCLTIWTTNQLPLYDIILYDNVGSGKVCIIHATPALPQHE